MNVPLLLLAAFAVVVLSSCAAPGIRILHYKGFDIWITDQYNTDRLCGTRYTDSGAQIKVTDHILGCWDESTTPPRIIVQHEHPEVLTHELAHRDGIADPEKAGYNW